MSHPLTSGAWARASEALSRLARISRVVCTSVLARCCVCASIKVMMLCVLAHTDVEGLAPGCAK